MSFISEEPGFKAEELSGLVLEIIRDNEYITRQRPENEYQLDLAKYRSEMATRTVISATQDTFKLVESIDEKTFNKHGISHDVRYVLSLDSFANLTNIIRLSGGTEVKNHQDVPTYPARETTLLDKRETRFVHILFRSPSEMRCATTIVQYKS